MDIYVEDIESKKQVILSNILQDTKISDLLGKVKKALKFDDEKEKFLCTVEGERLYENKTLKELGITNETTLYYGIQNRKNVLFQLEQINELKERIEAFKYDKKMIYDYRILNEQKKEYLGMVPEWKRREKEYDDLISETTKKLELLTMKTEKIEKKKEELKHDRDFKYLEFIENYQKKKDQKMKKIHPKTETLLKYLEDRFYCQGTDITFHLFNSDNLDEKYKLSDELLQLLKKENEKVLHKTKYWKIIAALCGLVLLNFNEKFQLLIDSSWTYSEVKYWISKKSKIPLHNILICIDKTFIIEEKNEKFIHSIIRTSQLKEFVFII